MIGLLLYLCQNACLDRARMSYCLGLYCGTNEFYYSNVFNKKVRPFDLHINGCVFVAGFKNHRNGIKRPKTNRYPSLKGVGYKSLNLVQYLLQSIIIFYTVQ